MKKIIILSLLFLASDAMAATRNIIPRADGEGDIGLSTRAWRSVHAVTLYGDGSQLTGINASGGDNLGSHIATKTVNMSNFAIVGASSVVVGTGNQQFVIAGGTLSIGNTSPQATIHIGPAGLNNSLNYNLFIDNYHDDKGQGKFGGNWPADGYWGFGPWTGAADNTLMFGKLTNKYGDWDIAANQNTIIQVPYLRVMSSATIVGTLASGGLTTAVSTHTQICLNGDCKTAWPTGGAGSGDNLGSHIATQTLNMNGQSIIGVASMTLTGGVTASSFTGSGTALTGVIKTLSGVAYATDTVSGARITNFFASTNTLTSSMQGTDTRWTAQATFASSITVVGGISGSSLTLTGGSTNYTQLLNGASNYSLSFTLPNSTGSLNYRICSNGMGGWQWCPPVSATVAEYYLTPYNSDVSPYLMMLTTATAGIAASTRTFTFTGTIIISTYATIAGVPGQDIPGGTWSTHIWASVSDGKKGSYVSAKVYKRDTGGTETQICEFPESYINTEYPSQYDIYTTSAIAPVSMSATDRLVIRYYGYNPVSNTLYAYRDNNYYSAMVTPRVEISLGDYVLKAGDTMTGALIANAGVYTSSAISANVFQILGSTIMEGGGLNNSLRIGGSTYPATLSGNVTIGYESGNSLSGNNSSNTLVGYGAGKNISGAEGTGNTCVGWGCLLNMGGSFNVGLGFFAGGNSSAGTASSGNTSIGSGAGASLQGGDYNTLLGRVAGEEITTGSNNIIIGYNTDAQSPTQSNYLNIGDAITGLMTVGSTMTFVPAISAPKFIGDGSGLTGLTASSDNLGNHIATMTLDLNGQSIINAASGTFTAGITASSFTGSGAALTGVIKTLSGVAYATDTVSGARITNFMASTDTIGGSRITSFMASTDTISGARITNFFASTDTVLGVKIPNFFASTDTLTSSMQGTSTRWTSQFTFVSSVTMLNNLGISGTASSNGFSTTVSSVTSMLCLLGDCRTEWPTPAAGGGDNLGNHIATKTLTMNGQSIIGVASMTLTGGVTASSFTAAGASGALVVGTGNQQFVITGGTLSIGNTSPVASIHIGPAGGSTSLSYNLFIDSYRTDRGQAKFGGNWAGAEYWGFGPWTGNADNVFMIGRTLDKNGTWQTAANQDVIVQVPYLTTLYDLVFGGKAQLYSRSKAQLNALTPAAVGEIYYCNDCSPKKVVVSTGTAAKNFAAIDGGTFQ